jgi:hypothetical protein
MASLTSYHLHIQELHRQVKRQVDALVILGDRFANEAQYQYRHDQARSLDDLKERLVHEIKDIEKMETASSIGSMQGTLIAGGVKFAVGFLLALASRSEDHPFSVGLQFAESSLERTTPFGNIVIAVGTGGLPYDVKTISVSKLARDKDKEESEVTAILESRFHVMTIDNFFIILEELKGKVLQGVLTLPVLASYLNQQSKRPKNTYSYEGSSFLLSPTGLSLRPVPPPAIAGTGLHT